MGKWRRTAYGVLIFVIGCVWFVNGLWCKVLGKVPRHQEIVAEVLGNEYAVWITRAIGVGEVALAIAIWLLWRPRFVALAQIVLVLTMNVIEFFRAPDLLLWGRVNFLYALLFVAVVFVAEWCLRCPVGTEVEGNSTDKL